MQNGHFGSKVKNAKKVRKTIVRVHYSCLVQKTARKNINIQKNESVLRLAKNGHNAKAIAYAKYSA